MDVNVKTAFLLTQEAYPHLKASGNASVIYVSSIAGYQPLEKLGPYSVSKTALLGLTKVLAEEISRDGIRVNGLAPGIIKTKFSGALQEGETGEKILSQVPANRFGTPDEMGAVAAFLASDDAAYVTGETLVAAGGMTGHL